MVDYKVRYGQVIDDVDTEQLSRVKVKVYPELADVSTDKLPWAKPFFVASSTTSNSGSHTPPIKESYVVVLCDKDFSSFYYLGAEYIKGLSIYKNWSEIQTNIPELSQATYPEPVFTRYENGNALFVNRSTGEMGVYNSNGTYIIIDAAGKLIINADNVDVLSDSSINLGGTSSSLSEFVVKGNELQAQLQKELIRMNLLVATLQSWVPVPSDGGLVLKLALTASGLFTSQAGNYSGILSNLVKVK